MIIRVLVDGGVQLHKGGVLLLPWVVREGHSLAANLPNLLAQMGNPQAALESLGLVVCLLRPEWVLGDSSERGCAAASLSFAELSDYATRRASLHAAAEHVLRTPSSSTDSLGALPSLLLEDGALQPIDMDAPLCQHGLRAGSALLLVSRRTFELAAAATSLVAPLQQRSVAVVGDDDDEMSLVASSIHSTAPNAVESLLTHLGLWAGAKCGSIATLEDLCRERVDTVAGMLFDSYSVLWRGDSDMLMVHCSCVYRRLASSWLQGGASTIAALLREEGYSSDPVGRAYLLRTLEMSQGSAALITASNFRRLSARDIASALLSQSNVRHQQEGQNAAIRDEDARCLFRILAHKAAVEAGISLLHTTGGNVDAVYAARLISYASAIIPATAQQPHMVILRELFKGHAETTLLQVWAHTRLRLDDPQWAGDDVDTLAGSIPEPLEDEVGAVSGDVLLSLSQETVTILRSAQPHHRIPHIAGMKESMRPVFGRPARLTTPWAGTVNVPPRGPTEGRVESVAESRSASIVSGGSQRSSSLVASWFASKDAPQEAVSAHRESATPTITNLSTEWAPPPESYEWGAHHTLDTRHREETTPTPANSVMSSSSPSSSGGERGPSIDVLEVFNEPHEAPGERYPVLSEKGTTTSEVTSVSLSASGSMERPADTFPSPPQPTPPPLHVSAETPVPPRRVPLALRYFGGGISEEENAPTSPRSATDKPTNHQPVLGGQHWAAVNREEPLWVSAAPIAAAPLPPPPPLSTASHRPPQQTKFRKTVPTRALGVDSLGRPSRVGGPSTGILKIEVLDPGTSITRIMGGAAGARTGGTATQHLQKAPAQAPQRAPDTIPRRRTYSVEDALRELRPSALLVSTPVHIHR